MERRTFLLKSGIFLMLVHFARADIPWLNCTYEDVRGTWEFKIGPGDQSKEIDCTNAIFKPATTLNMTFSYPNIAIDQFGNNGTWTMIYNQGFEFIVAGRKYFAFFYIFSDPPRSECFKVKTGWSHDVLGHDWACYNGTKSNNDTTLSGNNTEAVLEKIATDNTATEILRERNDKSESLINSQNFVDKINKVQDLWQAKKYSQFDCYTYDDYLRMAGGISSKVNSYPKPATFTKEDETVLKNLPKSFDWRNVNGENYVSPIRNQKSCGSCYAFASTGMAEARTRVQTNNTQQPIYSPQDVIDCCKYSQGCWGGFNYLVAGKYAEDFGFVLEECDPYKARTGDCKTDPKCERYYFTDYSYIGGYYGACNEARMLQAIYERGPIAVSVKMPIFVFNYWKGILTCQKSLEEKLGVSFNPFKEVGHGLVIVGWGYDEKVKEKYWIIKNSWGTGWGDKGFGKFRRGINDCNIESIAVEANPVFKL